MARYYFHVQNHIAVEDEEGQELPDLAAVHHSALQSARDLVCESIHEHGDVNLDHYIRVTDNAGAEVCRVTFRDAFTVKGDVRE